MSNKEFFVRPYQKQAVEEVVKFFFNQKNKKLGSLTEEDFLEVRLSDGKVVNDKEDVEEEKKKGRGRPRKDKIFKFKKSFIDKMALIVSPTASGKSVIMYEIRRRLAEIGCPTLALSYVATVAKQNADLGIVSTTVQALSSAIETALDLGLSKSDSIKFIAESLDIPEAFLNDNPCILVDESHLGLENITKLYRKVIDLIDPIIVVGFTATPRWAGLFKTIDLTDNAKKHVADPLASLLWTNSFLTLPPLLSFIKRPGLIFTRSVMSASVITDIFNFYYNDTNAAKLIVSNESMSVGFFINKLQESIIKGKDFDEEDDEEEPMKNEETFTSIFTSESRIYDEINNKSENDKINVVERKIGLFALKLVFTATILKAKKENLRSFYDEIANRLDGIPRLFESLRLVKDYCPNYIYEAFNKFIFGLDVSAEDSELSKELLIEYILKNRIGVKPKDFIFDGEKSIGISVYKVSTGFDFPKITSVIMAESVIGSSVLYRQRAGRGARKFMGKKYFDLIDVIYEDRYSDPSVNKKVTWLDAYKIDEENLKFIVNSSVPFRVKLSSDVSEEG